ncbi:TetR family transcriptional regulator [bacterium]|nr:TetR family transcriptional regulator [bacterium]
MVTVNRKMMILESLASALGEESVPKITTKILAQRSDVTEAALYKHFKGKNEIFLELFKFIEQSITDKLWEIRNQPVLNYQKIKNIFNFMIIFVEKNPGY